MTERRRAASYGSDARREGGIAESSREERSAQARTPARAAGGADVTRAASRFYPVLRAEAVSVVGCSGANWQPLLLFLLDARGPKVVPATAVRERPRDPELCPAHPSPSCVELENGEDN